MNRTALNINRTNSINHEHVTSTSWILSGSISFPSPCGVWNRGGIWNPFPNFTTWDFESFSSSSCNSSSCNFSYIGRTFNSYSASHDHWCTGTLLNKIMTAQWEGMGDVGSARYEPALLPPCPTIRVLSYSNCQRSTDSISKWVFRNLAL